MAGPRTGTDSGMPLRARKVGGVAGGDHGEAAGGQGDVGGEGESEPGDAPGVGRGGGVEEWNGFVGEVPQFDELGIAVGRGVVDFVEDDGPDLGTRVGFVERGPDWGGNLSSPTLLVRRPKLVPLAAAPKANPSL
jgi:hypothetical protein